MIVQRNMKPTSNVKWMSASFVVVYLLGVLPYARTLPAGVVILDSRSMLRTKQPVCCNKICEGPYPPFTFRGIDILDVERWNGTSFSIERAAPYSMYFLLSAPLLRHVHIQHNAKVFKLLIEHCALTSVPRTLRNLPELQKLFIRHCRLRHIDLNVFLHVRMLSMLDLSHNQITAISGVSVPGATLKTTELYLVNNSLYRVNMSVFAAMQELRCLHLDMNRLESISATTARLPALQELSVSYNRLRTFDLSNWTFLPSLRLVHGNNNQLTAAPIGWNSLVRLEALELSFNRLDSFCMDDLYLMPMRLLNLAGNGLSRVTTSSLHLRVPLESLRLNHNRLAELDISRWGMPNLWEFNVTHNRLTELRDVFVRFPNLSSGLDLRGNSWSCEWLRRIRRYDFAFMRYGKLATNESCPAQKHTVGKGLWICCWDAAATPDAEDASAHL